jgi:hypothetical protein
MSEAEPKPQRRVPEFSTSLRVTQTERYMLVNALQFFLEYFDPQLQEDVAEIRQRWTDVAKDTDLKAMDALGNRIACGASFEDKVSL